MTSADQPQLRISLLIAAGETNDGWVGTLVPATGDVRYEIQPDAIGSSWDPPYIASLVDIVIRP